jgi:RNA polymerase sigma-70 factor (ECF subfamily)
MAAWRISGRADWVDDLSNETWQRAFEARSNFEPGRPFLTWLVGILRNVFREQVRLRLRRSADDPTQEEDRTDPARVAADVELLAVLDECVRGLSPDEREIVRLRFFENQTLRAMAERLRIPEATLRESRIPEVLERLRGKLEARGLAISQIFSAQTGGELQLKYEV